MFDMITSQQIQTAIDRDEFLFHYQPKISLITGQVAGAEALIRWRQRSGVWVSPSEFIPIAAASPADHSDYLAHVFPPAHRFDRV
jgi:sensor c-di-GMP phosphodiesterase-like protein